MTAQAGQDVLVQIDLTGSNDFKTIAGLRASKISFNSQMVNVTNLGSIGRWRELIAGAGVRSASISGSGVFVDDETDGKMQELFFEGGLPNLKMRLPDFGDVIGKFQILSMDFAGNFDGEANFDFSFASAGPLTFVAHSV